MGMNINYTIKQQAAQCLRADHYIQKLRQMQEDDPTNPAYAACVLEACTVLGAEYPHEIYCLTQELHGGSVLHHLMMEAGKATRCKTAVYESGDHEVSVCELFGVALLRRVIYGPGEPAGEPDLWLWRQGYCHLQDLVFGGMVVRVVT